MNGRHTTMTNSKMPIMFAFIVALLGQAADVATTIYGLKHGAHETNGLMAAAINNWGYTGFILVKLSAVFVMTAISFYSRAVAVILALPFFYFAWHNLTVIASL